MGNRRGTIVEDAEGEEEEFVVSKLPKHSTSIGVPDEIEFSKSTSDHRLQEQRGQERSRSNENDKTLEII